MSVAVPLAVLGLAVAVSRLKRPVRGAGIAVAGGLVIAELFAVGLYLSVLPRQWAARDPGRFAQLLGGLSPADSVAASPQLWYGLARSHHPMAILYPWLNGLAYWRRVPQSLDSFDVVVLDRDDELLERERGRRPTERRFVIDGRQYVVLYH